MIRPREHLHEKACLAKAMISAIENSRDLEFLSDLDFRFAMQDNDALRQADDDLASGTSECICTTPDPDPTADLDNLDNLDPDDPEFDDTKVICFEHEAPVEACGSNPGFTGAPIFWVRFTCGCVDADDSMDTLDWVR